MLKNISWKLLSRPLMVLLLIVGTALLCISYSLPKSIFPKEKKGILNSGTEKKSEASTMSVNLFWKTADFYKDVLPANVGMVMKNVIVESKTISVLGVDTFYRVAVPPSSVQASGKNVLLLHGQAFTSKTWLDLKTINLLASLGHQVVAVDLPGYGETLSSFSGPKEEYLHRLINILKLSDVILISPSMSGGFSIPYIESHWKQASGYIPVAPINTASLQSSGSKIMIPTLIIYGDKDSGLGVSSTRDLVHLPNSRTIILPDARHPAYLDQPEKFHTLLYNFIKALPNGNQ